MATKTTAGEKIDLFKEHKREYAATAKPAVIKMSRAAYLAIDGRGAPGGDAFTAAIGALYGVAFTVKMTRKFDGRQDYAIGKLEALWGDGAACLPADQKDWTWKLMIRTPDFVAGEEIAQAAAVLLKRGKGEEVRQVRLEFLDEGACVQALHVGPYDTEAETIALMKTFAGSKGLAFHGRHHEIYLSDPRRIPPERLKTILRQPVRATK